MCGRYFLHSTADKLTSLFGEMPMPLLEPRYNIAPTQPVPVVRAAYRRGPRDGPAALGPDTFLVEGARQPFQHDQCAGRDRGAETGLP